MGWFGRNRETRETETPESEVRGQVNEMSDGEGNPEKKLDSSDRNRNFRESLKVSNFNRDDAARKLDTGSESGEGDEPGPRERSLPEKMEGDER